MSEWSLKDAKVEEGEAFADHRQQSMSARPLSNHLSKVKLACLTCIFVVLVLSDKLFTGSIEGARNLMPSAGSYSTDHRREM